MINREGELKKFLLSAIADHEAGEMYKTAKNARLYYEHKNPTIMKYQKLIYDQFGRSVPDIWSANNKIASAWFDYFVTQSVQYLLGNGVTFGSEETKPKLGRKFDRVIQEAATNAKISGVSFVYWNYDHVETFDYSEFVPLWDEENGSLGAGIRYWQIDANRPMRITLFTPVGVTEYIKRKGEELVVYAETRPYVIEKRTSKIAGERIVGGTNYRKLPIVPLWNNKKQSDLVGNVGTIDAYDLMTSGLVNNVSEGEVIYWVLKNCGGMDALDDAKFIEQLRTSRVVHADGDDGAQVDAHTVNVPFEASSEAIDRLIDQLFRDFMALRVEKISAGAVTNDQIQAAYEPLNQKTDEFEYHVTDCIEGVLDIIGIKDTPTYTRSQMSNRQETIESVVAATEHLSGRYVTEKILTALGDADKLDEILSEQIAESADRLIGANGGDIE